LAAHALDLILRLQPGPRRTIIRYTSAIVAALVMVMTLAKATNEPLLSNSWHFHSEGEQLAVKWLHDTPGKWSSLLWKVQGDLDSRLAEVYIQYFQSRTSHFVPLGGTNLFGSTYDYLVQSTLTDGRELRSNRSTPDASHGNV